MHMLQAHGTCIQTHTLAPPHTENTEKTETEGAREDAGLHAAEIDAA